MRVAVTLAVALTTSCCVSLEGTSSPSRMAQVAFATEPQCDKPGVRLDSIRRAGSHDAEPTADNFAPVSVKPDRYEIAVACQNPLNESRGACTFWGHPNEYPTYKMSLEAGIRYTFHCYEVGSDLTYNVVESRL
jgi:hypothetical protein